MIQKKYPVRYLKRDEQAAIAKRHREIVHAYLMGAVSHSEFFKVKRIAKAIDLEPRAVKCALLALQKDPKCPLAIEIWAKSRSSSWRITHKSE